MGQLTVKANGQHLTVDIQTPAGDEAVTYSDASLSTPITLPLAITADQDFYFPAGTQIVDITVTTAAGATLISAERHEIGTPDRVVLVPLPSEEQGAATDSSSSGGSGAVPTAKTSAYTAASGDAVLADASGGDFAVTLPAPALAAKVTVKNVGATGTVTVDPHAAETIDGAASYPIPTQWMSRDFLSDGTNWLVV